MAKVPLQVGNLRVEDDLIADFRAMMRAHFGKKVDRTVDPNGRPEYTESEYTDEELNTLVTRELREMWRQRFRNWKREQADTDIDL